MFAAGETFEGYQICRLLGESSLACTFLVTTAGREQLVLKVFKDERFVQDEAFAYLRRPRAAITQGKITNQSYLTFYRKLATAEVPQIGKRAYLVRSFVDGIDLITWRETPRTEAEMIAMLHKLCRGLDHLHQAGLIHGALCPQNILVTSETVKMTDFGTGASFLSPLLCQGEIAPDKRPFLPSWHTDAARFQHPVTDIYALGVLLYWLQKGTGDASVPVCKAIQGVYPNVDAFLEGMDENPVPNGSAPELAPRIELQGEGLQPLSSGLGYQVQHRLKQKGQYVFVVKNLERDDQALTIRAVVVSGSPWLQMKPREARFFPGEHLFCLILGPVQTPGTQEGKITLEICRDQANSQITRDIMVTATFAWGSFTWITRLIQVVVAWTKRTCPDVFTPLRGFQHAWYACTRLLQDGFRRLKALRLWLFRHVSHLWKWVVLIAAVALLLFYRQQVITFGVPYLVQVKEYWSSFRPQKTLNVREPQALELAERFKNIKIMLEEGHYLEAQRALQDLQKLFPVQTEDMNLLESLEKKLDIPLELTPSSRRQPESGDVVSLQSGKEFWMQLTPSDTCYLYIYLVGPDDQVAQLFPNPKVADDNPLQGGTTYHLPSGEDWVRADAPGEVTIYVVGSRWAAKDLEELFASMRDSPAEYRKNLIKRLQVRAKAQENGMKSVFFSKSTIPGRNSPNLLKILNNGLEALRKFIFQVF